MELYIPVPSYSRRITIHIAYIIIFICSSFTAEIHASLTDSTLMKDKGFDIQEHCINSEPFTANCMKNEIIQMTHAVYGRMKIGRCLASVEPKLLSAMGNDPKFLGCHVNILPMLNRKCSGLNHCEINGVLDNDFKKLQPCYESLQLYLEASYRCISVIEPDRSCTISVTSTAQHLMTSQSSSKLSCGSRHQPWKLEAPAGQQINVSLLDFGSDEGNAPAQKAPTCSPFGFIIEKTGNRNITLCGGPMEQKERQIFASESNEIQIALDERAIKNLQTYNRKLFIGFVAVGCSDIITPSDAWLRREGNEATVGCYTSRKMWTLKCVEGAWKGVIGNCSLDQEFLKDDSSVKIVDKSDGNRNEVVAILVIVFVGVIVCTLIICIGLVCLKRYYAISMKSVTKNHHGSEGFTDTKTLTQKGLVSTDRALLSL